MKLIIELKQTEIEEAIQQWVSKKFPTHKPEEVVLKTEIALGSDIICATVHAYEKN